MFSFGIVGIYFFKMLQNLFGKDDVVYISLYGTVLFYFRTV